MKLPFATYGRESSNWQRVWSVVTMVMHASCAGCGHDSDESGSQNNQFEVFSELEAVSQTHHRDLASEVERIKSAKQTPGLLARQGMPGASGANLSRSLVKLFRSTDELDRLDEQLSALIGETPEDDYVVDIDQAQSISGRYRELRIRAHQLVSQPDANFYVDWKLGLAIELDFVTAVQVIARLDQLEAVLALRKHQVGLAVDSYIRLTQLIRRLDEVPHVVCRLTAAQLRLESIKLTNAILQHPDIDLETLRIFRDRYVGQLSAWPDEQQVWIGDRAIGLHVYEIVRAGLYLSLLDDEENDRLQKKGMHIIKARSVYENVDNDEWFYLQSMRTIIEMCDRPWYERIEQLEEIYARIDLRKRGIGYPTVAAELLLPEINHAQQKMARDRARVEAWAIGLSLACGEEPPLFTINPETGDAYESLVGESEIEIRGLHADPNEPPVVIPRRDG